jgi:hypothetical protein
MAATIDLARLLGVIADHRVLPPPGSLPPDSDALRAALGEIVRGSRSAHAALIRQVAASRHVGVEELVRRARFVLACVALPSNGTYYELLGVTPRASSREIRRRWATLIQRYHPDHAGSEGGLEDQARRLIEAYQTLRDPEQRRCYDAELSYAQGAWVVPKPVEAPGSWRKLTPAGHWRWAPAAIAALGAVAVIAMVRWSTAPAAPRGAPRPVPRSPAPVASDVTPVDPETGTARAQGELAKPESDAVSGRGSDAASGTRRAQTARPSPLSVREAPLPSLLDRLAALDSAVEPAATEPGAAPRRDEGRREPPAREMTSPASPSGRPVPSESKTAASVMVPEVPPVQQISTPAPPEHKALPAPGRIAPSPEGWSVLIETFRGAYERKDVAALSGLFADDVRERTTTGKSAVEELYIANFRALNDIRYELSQMTAQDGAKEGEVLVRGQFRIRAVDARNGSRPLDVSGPIRWTLRQDREALRIVGIDYEASKR